MDSDRVNKEIDELFDDIDALLKNVDVGAVLTERGVNASLVMVAIDGVRAYLKGDKARAAEDLSTAAEEIASRHEASREREREAADLAARRKPS
jgi:hypothetical protein